MDSATHFLLSSTAMAFSKACLFTIFLHSVNFNLASLSFGRAVVTWKNEKEMSDF
jgi:hypothetical protein